MSRAPEIHSKERLQCDVCEKYFTRADNLTRHFQEAHLEPSGNSHYALQLVKPFKCDFCGSRYKRKENLDDHKASSHSKASSELFICSICLKTFTNVKNKKRHMNTVHRHTSDNHKCLHCNKSFSRKYNLAKHVKLYHSK